MRNKSVFKNRSAIYLIEAKNRTEEIRKSQKQKKELKRKKKHVKLKKDQER